MKAQLSATAALALAALALTGCRDRPPPPASNGNGASASAESQYSAPDRPAASGARSDVGQDIREDGFVAGSGGGAVRERARTADAFDVDGTSPGLTGSRAGNEGRMASSDLGTGAARDADPASVGAGVDGANVAGANVANPNVAGANVAGANVAGANVANPNVAGANVAGGNVAGANVAGRSVAGGNVAGTSVAGANVAGRSVAGANTNVAGTGEMNGGVVDPGAARAAEVFGEVDRAALSRDLAVLHQQGAAIAELGAERAGLPELRSYAQSQLSLHRGASQPDSGAGAGRTTVGTPGDVNLGPLQGVRGELFDLELVNAFIQQEQQLIATLRATAGPSASSEVVAQVSDAQGRLEQLEGWRSQIDARRR